MWSNVVLHLRWLLTLPCYVAFLLLSMLAAPALPLFRESRLGPVNNNNGTGVEPRLPCWLNWFMTQDNSLWGDNGWQTKHCPDYRPYWSMVKWLWRNPAYGFAVFCGIGPDAEGFIYEFTFGLRFRIGYLDGGLKGMYLLSIRVP